jgi:hypothetical protein
MNLKRREKILVGVTAGLAVVAGLWFLLLAGDSRSIDDLTSARTKLEAEIESKNKILQQEARDKKRLADWQRRALPADIVVARSLYQNWLGKLIQRTELHHTTLVANEPNIHRDQFTRLSYDLRGRGNLSQVVRFLYEFYTAGFLHQIRKIDLKPTQNSSDLEVMISIDALSLPTAQSTTQLTTETRHDLKAAKSSNAGDPKLADYTGPIVARNFFAPYVGDWRERGRIVDVPPPPPPPPPVDPADFAFVTGFTEVDGAAKVWLHERLANHIWQLGAGEPFSIGTAKGVVEAVHPEGDVVLDFTNGGRRTLHAGDTLHVYGRGDQPRPTAQPDNPTRPSAQPDNPPKLAAKQEDPPKLTAQPAQPDDSGDDSGDGDN